MNADLEDISNVIADLSVVSTVSHYLTKVSQFMSLTVQKSVGLFCFANFCLF